MPKKVVVIGGGTGTYTVLSGLKTFDLDLAAIVSMADSGGSAKKERDEWGLLPVSDLRKALIALAPDDDSTLLRELFNYRFSEGVGVEGMTFGNLFLVALSNILGSQEEAIAHAARLLKVKGRVLPVTLEDTNLVAEYEEGKTVVGEHAIDEPEHDGRLRIRKIYLLPTPKGYPEAIQAIKDAEVLVMGPGDLYTSLIPNLLVEGVAEAVRKSKGVKIFILNLMNKYGQTYGFSTVDHVGEVEKHLGGETFNFVLMNHSPHPQEILSLYAQEKSYPIEDNLEDAHFRVIRGDFLSDQIFQPEEGDSLRRSLIRHDPAKIARAILEIIG